MKFSSKVEKCGQSPMRKFHPYAVAAKARGIKVYHLNIGQPDVQTPPAFFEAIRKFEQPVLEYAPSPGIPELIDAIKGYYDKLDMHFDKSEIYITTGGSEALLHHAPAASSTTATRSSSPSRSTPTTTRIGTHLRRVHPPHPDLPRGGLLTTPSARTIEPLHQCRTPAPSWSRTPATPPAWC